MFQWRASVLNLIYHNILVFVSFYTLLSLLYRFVFVNNKYQKELFEVICIYSGKCMDHIPLGFLIAFYVQQVDIMNFILIFFIIALQVVTRWWDTYTVLPYPDKIALKIVSFCPGKVSMPEVDNSLCYISCNSGPLHQEPEDHCDALCKPLYHPCIQACLREGNIKRLKNYLGRD